MAAPIRAAAAFSALLGSSSLAFADDPGAAAQPENPSAYTLFNPVPATALRGMDTDRPNVTNTPHTVDAGHLQIETGLFDYAHSRDGAGDSTDTLGLGQVDFRLGILDDLEMNAAIDSYDFLRSTNHAGNRTTRASGPGDLVVGGKLNAWGDDGSDRAWATALAIQPQIKIPTAHGALGNGHPEFFFGLPFLVNLAADFHLGLQTIVSRERNLENTAYVTGWQNSASLDRVLVGGFDVYLEYAAHVTTEHGAPPQQTVDIGTTYPLGGDIVLDTGVNLGLNRAAPAVEWLSGLSIRF